MKPDELRRRLDGRGPVLLARRLGVDRATTSRWLRKRDPKRIPEKYHVQIRTMFPLPSQDVEDAYLQGLKDGYTQALSIAYRAWEKEGP